MKDEEGKPEIVDQEILVDLQRMTERQDEWPHWPILPMKFRDGNEMHVGFIIAGSPETVYVANVWTLKPGKDQLKDVPVRQFRSALEMLEHGWRVD